VVPVSGRTDRPDHDDAIAPTFEVFGLGDRRRTVARLFDGSGGEQVRIAVTRDGNRLRATVAHGAEHLVEGWTLRWVTGPLGGQRGPSAGAPPGEAELTLALP
jgi:hypothetical protein